VKLTTSGDTVEDVLEVPGSTELEWARVVPGKPEKVELDGLLARNQKPIVQTFAAELPEKAEAPVTGTREVERTASDLGIVVDEVDPGFRIEGQESRSFFRPMASAEIGSYQQGVRAPSQWQRFRTPAGFGLYDSSVLVRRGGKGDTTAVWEAELPEAGSYELFVYTGTSIGFGNDQIRAIFGTKKFGTWTYRLATADGPKEARLNVDGAARGWNSLGVFPFEAGKVRVELRDDVEDGIVVADAVRLTPAGGAS
jgi:hypothetical protein